MPKLMTCNHCKGKGQVFALRGMYSCGYCGGRGYDTRRNLNALDKWMKECHKFPFGTPEHIEAKRLLTFLEWFIPVQHDPIPDNSILKEFLGNSSLSEFKIWKHH